MPQLTPKALVLGALLSVVLAAANAYLGLFAGMTVSASIPAAVISMAVLRLFPSRGLLENNIVQTTASAGEALAAGVIFTLPALVMLDYWRVFDYWWVSLIAGLGGLLGVLFTVPLRRSLIVERGLAFPEGAATAEVLRTGEGGAGGALHLAWAALVGGLMKLGSGGLRLWPASAEGAAVLGPAPAYLGASLSPALLGVGYIVGINIASLVFAGGALAWFVAIPLYAAWQPEASAGADPAARAMALWSERIRYLGVGAMLVGGLWALASMLPSLWRVMRTGLDRRGRAALPETERDAPMPWLLVALVLLVVPIHLYYRSVAGAAGAGLGMTLMMVAAGFLFSGVAGYMAGLVGSSNNPVSGVTIATILITALLLLAIMGRGAGEGAAATILVGAVVCCAAAIAGDTMQDLKAGHLLGATPWKQQLVQAVGVVAAVLVMAPVLNLLLQAYGFGAPTEAHPRPLAAPQATLMASLARGVFGGELPWSILAAGGGIAAVVIAIDEALRRARAGWRAPVLAVAVGLYLPLELSVTIFAGGLVALLVTRASGAAPDRRGVLLAAGLITGEALMGILLAVPIVLSGKRDVLAVASAPLGFWPGLLLMLAVAYWIRRVAARRG